MKENNMLWIVDMNREVPLTAIKNTDVQSGDFLLFYQVKKHRHRKSTVPRIVKSWIYPIKLGGYSLKLHFKFTLRVDMPQTRTVNSQAGLGLKSKCKKKDLATFC